ncbi:hypothetical protein [Arthrobacter sp. NPDC057009]|uniref:hypothetical protein n=1 Tax=Arthrobacter sp. NPDC057009 TaxID=3345996 RepID=UPI00362634F0
MSTTALAGLAWMLLGFAALGLGRLAEGLATRTYVRSHPDGDVDRYIRGKRRFLYVWTGAVIIIGAAVLVYGLSGAELRGDGNAAERISRPAEGLVIAAITLIAGILMILFRDRFARSATDMLRGFETDRPAERVRRIGSVAMAAFGLVVIVIGLVIGSLAF